MDVDLDGNQMSAPQYRQMMANLFEPFGFQNTRPMNRTSVSGRKTSSWRASENMFPKKCKISSNG